MNDILRHLDLFEAHAGPVIDLPDVTSITADDRSDASSIRNLASITRWHRRFMRLGKEVILSGARPDVDGVEWVKIEKWKRCYRLAYSQWCQKELLNHFATSHVMVWQADGFALDPSHWTPAFLRYDYIGTPQFFGVGNGGFSLRSRALCEAARSLQVSATENEDFYLCSIKRQVLEQKGVRFAPMDVALKWGKPDSVEGCFGFHGMHKMHRVHVMLNRLISPNRPIQLTNGVAWDGSKIKR